MEILIVEDQKYPIEALEFAVNSVMSKFDSDYVKGSYDKVKCYNDARSQIGKKDYGLILLDNRMPYEDQGDLEDRDMHAFSDTLQNIGYSLIPIIKGKSPKIVVIGTSSLSKGELKGLPTPDFTMRKMWDEAEEDLERILNQVIGDRK